MIVSCHLHTVLTARYSFQLVPLLSLFPAMPRQKKKNAKKSVPSQITGPQETSTSMSTRSTRRSASAGGNLSLTTRSGVRKRSSATGGTPTRKRTRTAGVSERNDETATALTTADIPRIVAEVLRNVTNSGDLSEDDADDDGPATQDEDGSSGEDEGIATYLLYRYCYCVSCNLAHRAVAM